MQRLKKLISFIYLVLNRCDIRTSWFFADWIGAGNVGVVKSFRLERGILEHKPSGRRFPITVKSFCNHRLFELYRAIRDYGFLYNDAFLFDLRLASNSIPLQIELASNHSFPIFFEIFEEELYGFYLNKPCVVIDVGANIGMASLYFALRENVKRVYSYELLPANSEFLKRNIGLNELFSTKIVLNPVGWSNVKGQAYLDDLPAGTADKGLADIEGRNEGKGQCLVNFIRADVELSNIIDSIGNESIVLKLDCEGSEYEIIDQLNSSNLLNRIDLIMIEWHFHSIAKMIECLNVAGFAVVNRNIPNDGGLRGLLYAIKSCS
jgi:FkbM family methyltransferase